VKTRNVGVYTTNNIIDTFANNEPEVAPKPALEILEATNMNRLNLSRKT
jgi:hypothetical protein